MNKTFLPLILFPFYAFLTFNSNRIVLDKLRLYWEKGLLIQTPEGEILHQMSKNMDILQDILNLERGRLTSKTKKL